MEGELWREVYRMVTDRGRGQRPRRAIFDDAAIATTYLWAVLHDRPVCWACRPASWPLWHRRRRLPTPATMSRRLRTASVQGLLTQVEAALVAQAPASTMRWIDAKPLAIGGNSQDPDAAYGHAAGGKAKGYKLHAIADAQQGFVAWAIRPMNVNAQKVALDLIDRVDSEGYLAADGEYDSNRLYDAAGARGLQLLAPRRRGTRFGHKRHSPYRLRAAELLARPFGQGLLASRDGIERMFAHLTNLGFGLSPLPNWVRTLRRVELWVQAKLILYHTYRHLLSTEAA